MPARKVSVLKSLLPFVMLGLAALPCVLRAQMGNVLNVDRGERQATVHASGGFVRIEFVEANIVRIHASRTENFPTDTTHPDFNGPYYIEDYSRKPLPLKASETDYGWRLEPDGKAGCAVEIETKPLRLNVVKLNSAPGGEPSSTPLLQETPDGGVRFSTGRTADTFAIGADEHFIGFGADRHPLDMRGQDIVLETNELGKEGEGGGFPVPWVMSNRGYGLFLNNVDPTTRFDLGKSRAGRLLIDAGDGGREGWDFDLYVVAGDTFSDLMQGYIRLTGKPILPEKWFLGNLQSKCCDWRADDVIYIASRFRELGLPLDAMILDLQWREVRPEDWAWTPAFDTTESAGKRRNLNWSPLFGNVRSMFQTLDLLGVKLGLHENAVSTFSDDENGPGPYLAASLPDMSRTDVVKRLWAMHERIIADGADFWWQDQGERVNAVGANGYPMKNLNGSLWAKLVVEGMRREHGVSVPVIARSGPVGGHRYIAPWPGDVPAGLKFSRFDLDYIRNGGLAGYAVIGADMGGFYHGHTPDPENEVRRICDMLLVFPVIRTHGAYYKLPWMFSSEAQRTYGHYLEMRYRLMPYLYSAAIEAHETGRPILAPLCFDYGSDDATYDRDFDFLLGHDLLVAPVTEEAEKRSVYLPSGNDWRDFWNDKGYPGGETVTVDAPLSGDRSLPVFVKTGAALPMVQPALTATTGLFDGYTFHLYPAPGRTTRRDFLDRARALGESKEMSVTMTDGTQSLDVAISGGREVDTLYIHGVAKPQAVTVNGATLHEINGESAEPGWVFGPSDFPLQKETVVLKVQLPHPAAGTGGSVACTIRK